MLGTTVSHYLVTRELGVGGMGVVYEAQDTRLPRTVAVKFLPQEFAADYEAALGLLREAETVALINHPNICTIYEIDHDGGASFIVMERLEGVSLQVHMARGRLQTKAIIDIALQVTEALAAAHAKGVVHRDIKPGNIFVSTDGLVKVMDFGLARRFMLPDTGQMVPDGTTIPGRPLGTINYMAPERILQMPLDPRSDLFSLGVVIYEMATNRRPFASVSPADTVTNVLEVDPPPLTKVASDRPRALEAIVQRLLAKRADDRYQSAIELRDALRSVEKPARRWSRLFRWPL
jgi:serine/threonine protein kinase